MRSQKLAIDYQIGTLSLPENLKGFRIFLLSFSLEYFKQRVVESQFSKAVEAIQLTTSSFYSKSKVNVESNEQEYADISSFFPDLKFMRIIVLMKDMCNNHQIYELVKGFKHIDKIQIWHKQNLNLKQCQAEKNIVKISINEVYTPLILSKDAVVPRNVCKQLTIVKDSISYLKENCIEYYDKIKQWGCLFLQCSKEIQLPFLKGIKNILFTQLRLLFCYQCLIDSVEYLAVLQAPLLDQLSLKSNNITSVRPVIKINSNNLRFLDLTNNKIKECEYISQNNWLFLKLLCHGTLQDGNDIESIRFLAKFNLQKSKLQASLSYSERIHQNKLMQLLEKKGIDVW